MSAAMATKKPPMAGVGRLSDNNHHSSAQSRSTPRSATSGSHSPSTVGGTPSRPRTTRTTTPVSARAAAHRSSISVSHDAAQEAARAETVALIDDLKERLEKADAASDQYKKQSEVLQSRLDDALKEQAKLEERVHESDEQIEGLQNEKKDSARQIREMETIYEAERSSMIKEKEEMANKEEEMQSVINRLKETINQKNADEELRPTRQSTTPSPNVDSGNFAPPSSIQRSDSRNNSKLLLQKDKLIESLRLELAEAQIKLVESENQGGGRLQEVERLLMEARMANARLMEDNESYQLLLQEKTLHGDFGKGDFSYMNGAAANQDALNALEGRPSSSVETNAAGGTTLADELGSVVDDTAVSQQNDADYVKRLEGELKALKDQNKALTLYINKIIERLLQHQEFEHILDQSLDAKPNANVHKDLPPAPSEKPMPPPSFLQRAKSIAVGSSTTTRKARPMSYVPTSSAHDNPETAPSIPIGLTRNMSTRRGGRPMSDQLFGAAHYSMYKVGSGPISPTLSSPRHSGQFFGGPISGGSATPRQASGVGAPSAGNFPGMRSETSSISGDSAGDATSSSQSPPRTIGSTSHRGEGPARFEGGKPRALRLVQENPEVAHNKRSSWLGWAQSAWASKKEESIAVAPVAEVIRE